MIFGVVANPRKEDTKAVLRVLRGCLNPNSVLYSDDLSEFGSRGDRFLPIEELAGNSDAFLSFGGDGTLLRTARFARGKPIAGINLGGLGFLTVFREEETQKIVESIQKGEFDVEERMGLEAIREKGDRELFALNDVTISVNASTRMIELEVSAGDEFLNRYRADGVIVSTSTGSTAYNLASGGPIVHPGMKGVVISPICAHTLSVRPVLLPAEMEILITARSKGESILLSADGQDEVPLESGETVRIVPRERAARLVRLSDTPRFFEILRTKLRWG
jgi:NAD+ kinase